MENNLTAVQAHNMWNTAIYSGLEYIHHLEKELIDNPWITAELVSKSYSFNDYTFVQKRFNIWLNAVSPKKLAGMESPVFQVHAGEGLFSVKKRPDEDFICIIALLPTGAGKWKHTGDKETIWKTMRQRTVISSLRDPF